MIKRGTFLQGHVPFAERFASTLYKCAIIYFIVIALTVPDVEQYMMSSCRIESLPHLRSHLLARLRARGASWEDAEDAIQEAMIRLPDTQTVFGMDCLLPQYEQRLLAWLTTTAWRLLLDQRRHTHPGQIFCLQFTDVADRPNETDITEAIHLRLLVAQAWHSLNDADRRLLHFKAVGNSCVAIAQRYGLCEEVVKKRIQRARTRFARQLAELGLESICSTGHRS